VSQRQQWKNRKTPKGLLWIEGDFRTLQKGSKDYPLRIPTPNCCVIRLLKTRNPALMLSERGAGGIARLKVSPQWRLVAVPPP